MSAKTKGPVGSTRLFPDRVGRAVLVIWVRGNSCSKTPSRSTAWCAGAAEPGHPGHPPLPDQGTTRLPYPLNRVVAATAAAVVVVAGKVVTGCPSIGDKLIS